MQEEYEQDSWPHPVQVDTGDREELTRIALTLSRRSTTYRASRVASSDDSDTLANLEDDDPSLDPENKAFNLEKWLRVFLRDLDHENIKSKRAGVVFKDLGVSGSGSALQLQHTIADMFTAPFRPREYLHTGDKHKQILRSFSGNLRSGELLIVLGRPGSGCSTLLKTMCGELHGLSVDKGSTIHYNGLFNVNLTGVWY